MITSIEEYNQRLQDIENNPDFNIEKIINPSSEEIFEIDLNTREIAVPKIFQNGTVEYDHNAETLYFRINRYFDNTDLFTKTFVMQFKNSKNQGQISAALSKYLDGEKEDKIIILWKLSNNATNVSGLLQFALKIYSLEEIVNDIGQTTTQYTYNLNTKIASFEISKGFNFSLLSDYEEEVSNWDEFVSEIYLKFENLENKLINEIQNKNNSYESQDSASGQMLLYQNDYNAEISYAKTIPLSYNKNNLVIGSIQQPIKIQNYKESFIIDINNGDILTKGKINLLNNDETNLSIYAKNNKGYVDAKILEINADTFKINGDLSLSANSSFKIGSSKIATEEQVDNLIDGVEDLLKEIIQGED